jgi:micrococcal nuclease
MLLVSCLLAAGTPEPAAEEAQCACRGWGIVVVCPKCRKPAELKFEGEAPRRTVTVSPGCECTGSREACISCPEAEWLAKVEASPRVVVRICPACGGRRFDPRVTCFKTMAAMLTTGTPPIPGPDFSAGEVRPVKEVTSGGVIVVQAGEAPVAVRLIGVDAPQAAHPSEAVQEHGKAAVRFVTDLLAGERVYLLHEGEKPAADKYGNRLAYAYRYPDGLFVNAEIIRQGYGYAGIGKPFAYLEEFRRLEALARKARRGLWRYQAAADAEKQLKETVYYNVPGKRYHRAECAQLRDDCRQMSAQEARKAGLKPCPDCRPPGYGMIAPAAEPEKPPTAEQPEPALDVTVYVTEGGKEYHLAGCRLLDANKTPMKLSKARLIYEPCKVCKPPQ